MFLEKLRKRKNKKEILKLLGEIELFVAAQETHREELEQTIPDETDPYRHIHNWRVELNAKNLNDMYNTRERLEKTLKKIEENQIS